jgi:hypothetical protein
MTDIKDEIAELRAEIAALKAPPKSREQLDAECRAFQDEMHKMRERRMGVATPPSVVRDWNVLDTATCQDLRTHGTVQSPSQAGASGTVTKVSSSPGIAGTGWQKPIPLGPPPGIGLVDALCIADDVRQRAEKLKR